MTFSARYFFCFLTSVVFSLVLTDLPIPSPWHWWVPQWVLLTIFYLRLRSSYLMGLKRAWVIGLCLDVLLGGLIGRYALICMLVSYFADRIKLRFWIYTWWQQSLLVGLLIMVSQLVLCMIQSFIGHPPQSWMYWGSSITSIFCWPVLFLFYRVTLDRLFLATPSLR
ncbi:MAG TPA: rod shape-determining protein MreD [Gammaproteobacteria bacterium]|nr:rod shape-determining protein MreD [Gammaproteobacteria bacterium]